MSDEKEKIDETKIKDSKYLNYVLVEYFAKENALTNLVNFEIASSDFKNLMYDNGKSDEYIRLLEQMRTFILSFKPKLKSS